MDERKRMHISIALFTDMCGGVQGMLVECIIIHANPLGITALLYIACVIP